MKIPSRLHPTLLATALAAAASTPAPAHAQASSLAFISEPGDYIGQGQSRVFSDVETARRSENEILVEARRGDEWFHLLIAAPEGKRLKRGVYENVVLALASRPAARPGLFFYGNNRGCERIAGRFEVEQIRFAAFGYVEHLRANFEQRCDGAAATLWGDVIVNNPPKPREMRVRLGVEPRAVLHADGAVEARPYYTITCQYPASGRIAGRIEQALAGGGIAYGSFAIKTGCGPTPQRGYLPISSDGAAGFTAGPAIFSVEARMEDPNYAEYETDAEVVRNVSRKIKLRRP